MLEIIKSTLNDKSGALTVIISVLVMAIGGSYKLHTDHLEETNARVEGLHKSTHSASERLHELDKRITILEYKND